MEFTVISDPKLTVLTPSRKFVPFNVTDNDVWPRAPLVGLMLVSVGAGLPTLNTKASVALPPPGGALVTVTLLAATTALGAIVMFAVALVGVFTVKELTVTPTPNEALVIPVPKFVPVKATFMVCPRAPAAGLIDVSVGARFCTVNASVRTADPPPGGLFVTVTVLVPAVVAELIVMLAVI